MCQKLLLYTGEQKAQKERQKIPEGFGRKGEKTTFIAGVVSQKKKKSLENNKSLLF